MGGEHLPIDPLQGIRAAGAQRLLQIPQDLLVTVESLFLVCPRCLAQPLVGTTILAVGKEIVVGLRTAYHPLDGLAHDSTNCLFRRAAVRNGRLNSFQAMEHQPGFSLIGSATGLLLPPALGVFIEQIVVC